MAEKKSIFEAINGVMKDCGAVGKDDFNPQQKYKYRGIDAIMNALNPALVKNGVFVTPEVIDEKREERETQRGGLLIYSIIKVRYTFYAPDGSSVSAVVTGEGMDSGDKASNKAMSAAFKYACFQVFCIPTEEMLDSEQDSPEPTPRRKAKADLQPTQRPAPQPVKEDPKQAARPEREIMIAAIRKSLPPERIKLWTDKWGCGSLEEARDMALAFAYDYHKGRGDIA